MKGGYRSFAAAATNCSNVEKRYVERASIPLP